jgi:hypothetical protein
MNEEDTKKFNTLLSVGMLTSLLEKVDDAALNEIIEYHDDDFRHLELCYAIRQFKRTFHGQGFSREALEEFCRRACLSLDAQGILLLIHHKGDRAEVIGGERDAEPNTGAQFTADKLRRLADEVESGSGQQVGDHGHFYPTP